MEKDTRLILLSRWNGIKSRCSSPADPNFYSYGARGISLCDEWLDFERFYHDVVDDFEPHLELDRVNPYGDYSPENTRWITPEENQNRDKRERPSTVEELELMKQNYINAFDSKIEVIKMRDVRKDVMWHLVTEGYNGSQLAQIFGIHRSTAHEIIKQMPEGWESPWHKTK